MKESEFFAIWRKAQGKNTEAEPCPIAKEFEAKLQDIIFKSLNSVLRITRPHISQAKYMLQEEYHHWRKSLPLHHSKHQHHCVLDVYEESFDRLDLMELTIRPVMNVIVDYEDITRVEPPAPAPAPPVQPTDTLFLGETND